MKYSRSKRTASRKIGGQTVVIDLEGRVVYGLNASAGAIWEAVAHAGSAAEVAGIFEPAAQPSVVEQAVGGFLATLRALGLVCPAEDDTAAPHAGPAGPAPFATPEVLWHEPLTSFAQSCAMYAGTGEPCDSSPVR